MASNRHLSRIAVVQALFAWEFRGTGDPEAILTFVLDQLYTRLIARDFAFENLRGILKERDRIRTIVEEHAPEWSFEKIAPVDRVILEQGVYELIASPEVPPLVAVNEAIEVAKEMGGENTARFINGVLSNVMKTHRPHEPK